VSGNSRAFEFEAAWWTRGAGSDRFRDFPSVDAAMAWLRAQLDHGLHEWIVRRRSVDGWRAVASGTAADLRA